MNLREQILNKVLAEGGFWSYDKQSLHKGAITDEQLIEAALERLDIEEIDLLFKLFPLRKIKNVWLRTMVVQGDYYHSLNRFYAWYYFGIRRPDSYLKSMLTRHISQIAS